METKQIAFEKEYPRPQFRRKQWLNLNGEWDFGFDDADRGENEGWWNGYGLPRKINVPFVYECAKSGIGETELHPVVWYQRTFSVPESWRSGKVMLNFQGVDHDATVWVNGRLAGTHSGGYAAFSVEVTGLLKKEEGADNLLVVRAQDSLSRHKPRGKQRWLKDSFGCWYVQSTGIWKTVWLEHVPENRLLSVKITPDVDKLAIDFDFTLELDPSCSDTVLRGQISFAGRTIRQFAISPGGVYARCSVALEDPACRWAVMLWTPEEPNLYDVRFTLEKDGVVLDEVSSYFGLRKISASKGRIYLNNHEIFQRLVLNQGYWRESLLTPPSTEAILSDLDQIKEFGFNGMRVHQKIEDDQFLYWCDKKGLLVWSEMAATYEFSDDAVAQFTAEWMEIVKQQYNHPCIITWTPFNESWGIPLVATDKKQQAFTVSIYNLTKTFDAMRPVITNDGWEHTVSDIITIHDYDGDARRLESRYENMQKLLSGEVASGSGRKLIADGFDYRGQPFIITEYGGVAFAGQSDGWGYGKSVTDEESFVKRFRETTAAIQGNSRMSGYCYTQFADVQQEINGLVTEDRQPKVDSEQIRRINEART